MNERSSHAGRGLWAVWFVVASLIALVAVPAYLGRRVAEQQSRIIDVLEVAGGLSSRLTLLKSQQMGSFEVFALTGDPTYRDRYVAGIAEEDTLFAQLTALAQNLDFDIQQRLGNLRLQSDTWHATNAIQGDSASGALPGSRSRFVDLQRATLELDRAIQAEVAEGRLDMEAATALQSRLTFGLGFLALAATLLVARVGFRLRDLGEEAESGRSDAELARRQTAAVLEATGDGVLGIDKDGLCTSLNQAGAELLGCRERDVMGRNVHDMLFHTAADGTPCPRSDSAVLAALAEGRALDSTDGAVIASKRGVFPARWSLRPLRDDDEIQGAVLTFTDMTAIRNHEAALRRAIEQRDEVVSIVSHDLRNPLGVVLAASDLLLDLPLEEGERRRQLEIIQRSGRRMQTLIEDLLDVAKIEAGAFVVRPSLEDVGPILEEARALFADQAERRSVKLTVMADGAGPRVRVDRDRILQALANLLDNALRVTPEGGSVVIGRREEPDRVTITVSDTGPGVPESMQARLFQRFTQSKSQRGGGAGLGLAIVRGVAEAHGGSVGVRSVVGAGSTFEIRLPRG